MNDWFEWNGVRCTDLGIHVLEQPPITLPAERVTFTEVPGRSGSLTMLEGESVYDDLILTANCIVRHMNNYAAITSYLRGSGKVEFANRPGGCYYARIVNQIPFEKILRGNPHRSFAVNFRCKPFWYPADAQELTVTVNHAFITNPGNVYSEPRVTVYGEGDVTLVTGMTVTELTDVRGKITLDSILMEAYKDSESQNRCVGGDFPLLQPGQNAISWIGNVSKVEIVPNWRML